MLKLNLGEKTDVNKSLLMKKIIIIINIIIINKPLHWGIRRFIIRVFLLLW